MTQSQRSTVSLGESSGTINAEVNNCIFWDNRDTSTSNTTTTNVLGSLNFPQGNWTISNSLDLNSFSNISTSGGNTISNVINQDPMFALASNSNHQYSLTSTSPAIDAGENSLIPSGITTDFLNNQRIFNTTVDIGVYEFGSIPLSTNELDNLVDVSIAVYPNPTKQYITINSKHNFESLRFLNSSGEELINHEFKPTLDIGFFERGVYFLQLIDREKIITKKIIKL